MSEDGGSSTNITEFRKRYEAEKRQHPYLPEGVDTELGEIAGEALRAVLHREIELASMRWAREGELLPVGEPTAKSVSPVFSASEACAGMALQAAKRSSGSVTSRFRGPGYANPYCAAARRIQRRSAACSQRYRLRLSSRSRH